jgi:hypothetical protein
MNGSRVGLWDGGLKEWLNGKMNAERGGWIDGGGMDVGGMY